MKFLQISSSVFCLIILMTLFPSSTESKSLSEKNLSINPLDVLNFNRKKRSEDEEHFVDVSARNNENDYDEPEVEVVDDPEMLAGLQNDKAQSWMTYGLVVVGVVVLGVGGYF